jgi:hypothetical protein
VLGGEFQALDPFGRFSGDGRFNDRELHGGGLGDARVKVTDGDEPTSVPVPSSIWLLAVGLVGGFLRSSRSCLLRRHPSTARWDHLDSRGHRLVAAQAPGSGPFASLGQVP